MSLEQYLTRLKDRHTYLEEQIKAEMTRPMPDFAAITELKKKKLKVKELVEAIYRKTRRPGFKTS